MSAPVTGSDKEVLLMFTIIKVANSRQPKISTYVAVLFDVGSQQTFITDALANHLHLCCHGSKDMEVAGFDDQARQHYTAKHVSISLRRKDGSHCTTQACTVPKLTGTIATTRLTDEGFSHLKKNNLSSIVAGWHSPRILVDAD